MNQSIPLDGHTIEIRRIPGGPGPALVLLHEGLGSVSAWRDFPERLAQATGRAVVAYSRAGYGQSSPVPLPRPLDYMQREGRKGLPRLLDALGLDRVVLVGHSDGASIALVQAGADRSGRVAGVVVMAPHSFVEDMCLVSIAEAKTAFETTDLRARLARHHADVDVAFWGWNRAWLDPAFKAEFDIRADLPRIQAPVLVIQGRQDQYGTIAQVDAVLEAAPDARAVLLDDCGHSPHKDQPEATIGAIAEFVQTLSRTREREGPSA